MLETIIGALLPIVVTLLLGYMAGWHHDFDAKAAAVLNRMVMLYALPLSLFAGMVSMSRDKVLSQGVLAAAILAGMAGGYVVVFALSRWLFRRDLMTASLQALAIAGPAVPFVGVSVLGHLFGGDSAIPISVAGLVMNLIQVPVTLMLLSAGAAQRAVASSAGSGAGAGASAPPSSFMGHVIGALREPVVWAPLAALVLVVLDLHFPPQIEESLTLLGRATGGVALFASGIVLFSRRVAVSLPVIVSVAARNVAIPAIVWGGMLALGLGHDVTREAVLTLAIPTASICVILAVQYQAAEQEMASTLFFSTILSVVTMGGFIWLTA